MQERWSVRLSAKHFTKGYIFCIRQHGGFFFYEWNRMQFECGKTNERVSRIREFAARKSSILIFVLSARWIGNLCKSHAAIRYRALANVAFRYGGNSAERRSIYIRNGFACVYGRITKYRKRVYQKSIETAINKLQKMTKNLSRSSLDINYTYIQILGEYFLILTILNRFNKAYNLFKHIAWINKFVTLFSKNSAYFNNSSWTNWDCITIFIEVYCYGDY